MPGGSVRRRRLFVVLGSATVGVVVLCCWALFGWPSGVDTAQEQAMRASIESHLEKNHWHGVLAADRTRQDVRWFCAGQVIEIEQDGPESKVGIQTMCREFAAAESELVAGSSESVARLAIVTSPPRPAEVLRVESAPDGAGNAEWVRTSFSWMGAKKLRRAQASENLANATAAKARSAFGLPADAPVRRPR